MADNGQSLTEIIKRESEDLQKKMDQLIQAIEKLPTEIADAIAQLADDEV